jgi:hypothetical protein
VLFSQSALRGELKRAGKGRRVLTLHGVSRQTVWFQDRPGRKAGQTATGNFVRDWARMGFADDVPNAALTLLNAKDDSDTVVVELAGRPHYDGARHTISYTVRLLDDAPDGLERFQPDAHVPHQFSDATLFIDSSTTPPDHVYRTWLPAGTNVRLADGTTAPIEKLSASYQVRGFAGGWAEPVTGVQVSLSQTIQAISIETDNGGHVVAAPDADVITPNGPTAASELVPGITVLTQSGAAHVTSVSVVQRQGAMVSLQVDSGTGDIGAFFANGIAMRSSDG